MAAYTAGKVAADELTYVGASGSYVPRPYAPAASSGALPSEPTKAASPSERAPGDYLAVFAATALASGPNTLYTAPRRTTAVVREVTLSNPTASPVTARVRVAGALVEAGLTVPAGESRSQAFAGWIVEPGQTLQAEGSASGLVVYASGVEEVH